MKDWQEKLLEEVLGGLILLGVLALYVFGLLMGFESPMHGPSGPMRP